jgi:hypothetical protein
MKIYITDLFYPKIILFFPNSFYKLYMIVLMISTFLFVSPNKNKSISINLSFYK